MYQTFRVLVSVVLGTLMFLSVIFGMPYISFVHLEILESQKCSKVWAACILLTIIVLLISMYFWFISNNRYYEASVTTDFRVNYKLVKFMLFSSFILSFSVAWVCVIGHFDICSRRFQCKTPTIARIRTCVIVGLVFNALHVLILCGYAILLAIVASPFHAVPVLLLYLSCICVFVITVSDSINKCDLICVIIVILINVILWGLIIWAYFIMVTLIGEYSKDEEGLWSVIGGFIPALINILLGYFIREIINLLSPKDQTEKEE